MTIQIVKTVKSVFYIENECDILFQCLSGTNKQ